MPAWADGNWSAGTDPGYLSELLHFWQHSFEWRKQEQILNKFSHFKTEIAGIDIHYIHQRGKGPTPFPILLTHGYPPREWAQRFFNVRRWQEMPRGGHFAAMEEPELLAEDLRTWFRAFRTLQES
jgi:pimeloyl-ACP methyl ester carboxylesterase